MLDTMIFKSRCGTSARTRSSTCPTSFSVNSSRVPEGAFKLMTNWLGSVRGKYYLPSIGYRARLKRKSPVMPMTVATGRSKPTFSVCS